MGIRLQSKPAKREDLNQVLKCLLLVLVQVIWSSCSLVWGPLESNKESWKGYGDLLWDFQRTSNTHSNASCAQSIRCWTNDWCRPWFWRWSNSLRSCIWRICDWTCVSEVRSYLACTFQYPTHWCCRPWCHSLFEVVTPQRGLRFPSHLRVRDRPRHQRKSLHGCFWCTSNSNWKGREERCESCREFDSIWWLLFRIRISSTIQCQMGRLSRSTRVTIKLQKYFSDQNSWAMNIKVYRHVSSMLSSLLTTNCAKNCTQISFWVVDRRCSMVMGNACCTRFVLFEAYLDSVLIQVKKLAPKEVNIRISAPTERLTSTWTGGSILATLDTFHKIMIPNDQRRI